MGSVLNLKFKLQLNAAQHVITISLSVSSTVHLQMPRVTRSVPDKEPSVKKDVHVMENYVGQGILILESKAGLSMAWIKRVVLDLKLSFTIYCC